MIAAEKINYRIAKVRVQENLANLLKTGHTIKDIFEVSFSKKNFTLFNLVKHNNLTEVTYGEAEKKIRSFAGYFQKKISKDEHYVGLLLENSAEWIYSFYGLLMAGFTPICLSTQNGAKHAVEILERVNSHTIVTNLPKVEFNGTLINPFEISGGFSVKESWSNEIIFTTSGTSGVEKIIRYTGEELTSQVQCAAALLKKNHILASNDTGYLKHLLILPLYHIFGFIAVFLWFTFFNTTIIIPSSMAPNKIREAAMIGEPSHIFAVPLFWENVVSGVDQAVKAKKAEKKFKNAIGLSLFIQRLFPLTGARFVRNKLFKQYLDNIFGPTINVCITGGAAISKNTLRVINGLGYPLVNGFGSTEIGISSFSSLKRVKTRLSDSIGEPFDAFEYRVSNEGELLVKGNPSFNAMFYKDRFIERDRGEYIYTADYARKVGKNYFVEGRMDEIFVGVNGENYSLPLIEKDFKIAFASDVVVIPSENRGLGLLLIFGESASDFAIKYELNNIINSEAFAKHKINEVYYLHHDVEKANGLKLKRKVIMSMKSEFKKVNIKDFTNKEIKFEVNEEILNLVIDKFKVVTGKEEVNKDSDFFMDLGGDSLKYFELIQNLEYSFGKELVFEDGFKRTPLQFALLIEESI